MNGSSKLKSAEEAMDRVRENAEAAGEAVKDEAQEVSAQARQTVAQQAEQGRDRISGAAERLARAFDDAAADMTENAPARPALEQAAAGARRAADLINERDIGDVMDATDRFARRNPGLFLGAAALTGFALSRFATARPDTRVGDPVLDPIPPEPPAPTVPVGAPTFPADPVSPSPTPAAPHLDPNQSKAPNGMGTV
jgi:hypothetical protein